MRLLTLLTERSPNKAFISIVAGMAAGLANAVLIPVLLGGVNGADVTEMDGTPAPHTFLGLEVANYRFAVLYGALCLLILMTRYLSHVILAHVALDAASELRLIIYRRVLQAPVARLESLGIGKLVGTITADIEAITLGAMAIPSFIGALVTLAGMLLYLFLLDSSAGWWILVTVAAGVATYHIPAMVADRSFLRQRRGADALNEAVRALVQGAKELKLSVARRASFFETALSLNERVVVLSGKRAHTAIALAFYYGQMLNLLAIGVMSFIFINYHSVSTGEAMGMVLALLFIMGPVSIVLNATSPIVAAGVSFRRLDELLAALPEEDLDPVVEPAVSWHSVQLCDVSYIHEGTPDGFEVGPVNLEFHKGEVTFVAGGNGSGKSTLCKLLSLHYEPHGGQIHFGATTVDRQTRNRCRQTVAAIFTDYYLFERLLSVHRESDRQLVQQYLGELGLAEKVSVDGSGRLSTLALSDGQRKRLALLAAILEDRQLYIFDEWAADQDPVFKSVFYHNIIPDLKARGKAVVVISHDDRYFHLADQMVVMESGRLIRTERHTRRTGDEGQAALAV